MFWLKKEECIEVWYTATYIQRSAKKIVYGEPVLSFLFWLKKEECTEVWYTATYVQSLAKLDSIWWTSFIFFCFDWKKKNVQKCGILLHIYRDQQNRLYMVNQFYLFLFWLKKEECTEVWYTATYIQSLAKLDSIWWTSFIFFVLIEKRRMYRSVVYRYICTEISKKDCIDRKSVV